MKRSALGTDEKLGKALVEGAYIRSEQLESAVEQSRKRGKRLAKVLVEQGILSPETVATVLSSQLNLPLVELNQFKVQPELLELVPERLAREKQIIPLSVEGNALRVAMDDPQDIELIDNLSAVTKMRIKPVIPLGGGIKELIELNYKVAYQQSK